MRWLVIGALWALGGCLGRKIESPPGYHLEATSSTAGDAEADASAAVETGPTPEADAPADPATEAVEAVTEAAVETLTETLPETESGELAEETTPSTPEEASGDASPSDEAESGTEEAAEEPAPCEGPTCVGAAYPAWSLLDFQPKSPGYDTTYGPTAFTGHVTVLALLAGW